MRRLVLRDWSGRLQSGVVMSLYSPQLVSVGRASLRIQGFEPVTTHNQQTAAVVQEWRVILFGSVPVDAAGLPEVAGWRLLPQHDLEQLAGLGVG